MEIREVNKTDLQPLLELYTQLHDNDMPAIDINLKNLWNKITTDTNHHIIVGVIDGKLICSCVIIIIPNLTHGQQPYALIENVITHEKYRNKGFATAILKYARQIAISKNCYKIMLMTGAKKEETLNFYEKSGFNRNDKTAFVQWL